MKSLVVALVLALSPPALAEDPAAAADLAVTPEQRKEIRQLVRDGATREEAQQQVLSEEQLAALSGRKAKEKRREAGRGMLDELDLTDEQRQEIEAIRAAGGGRKEIHAVLTEAQKTALKERKRERKGKGKEGGERRREGKSKGDVPAEAAPAEEAPAEDAAAETDAAEADVD